MSPPTALDSLELETELGPGFSFGSYEIEAVLGRGSFATVYRAVLHGEFGFRKRVALKVLHRLAEHSDDRDAMEFLREAQLGARIRHPNLVEFYECGRVGRQLYIALELVHGPNLSQVLRLLPHEVDPVIALVIAQQVARGLVALHEAQIDGQRIMAVHRDFKPANVLLSTQGQAKLTDYGITRFAADFYQTMGAGELRGSPLYMSPEQAAGQGTTQASDVYSFGAVVLSLLDGAPIFAADSLPEILERVRAGDSGDALERARDQYPALADILAVCLEVDPATRYPGAGALFTALRTIEPPPFSDELIADIARKGLALIEPAQTAELPTEESRQQVNEQVDSAASQRPPAETPPGEEPSTDRIVDSTRWDEIQYRVPPHRRTWALVWALVALAMIGATVQLVQFLFG